MTRTKIFTAIFAMAMFVIALPAIASAQYGNGGYNNGQYDPYSQNGRYGNGQYGNNGNMSYTLRDLKSRASQLQSQINRELDHSRYNGSSREDQVNQLAKNFKNAVQHLDSSYNNRNDGEMRRVMDTASQLDRAIGQSRMSPNVRNQWQAIRGDLSALGIGYGNGRGRGNGRYGNGGYNTGGYGNGNYNTGKPSWWPF